MTGRRKGARRPAGRRKQNRRTRARRRERRLTFASACSLLAILLLFAAGGNLDWEGSEDGGSVVWQEEVWQSGDAWPENGGSAAGGSTPSAGQGAASGREEDGAGESLLTVTYLDVGQSDCTVLQCGEHAMMIDGGGNSMADTILDALEALGIKKFDYVVATHSHEDHIGGLDAVLANYPADYIVCLREDVETKSYLDFLEEADNSGAAWITPEPGLELAFGEAQLVLLAPSRDVLSETNNRSVALLLTFGKTRFLFTGDAEEESERAMLELGVSLEADVFQAGHHGSSTSNTEAFVEAVDPVYAVISCGAGNSYGHPHSEVLARFEEHDVQIYRTDTMGTITIVSDGEALTVRTSLNGA